MTLLNSKFWKRTITKSFSKSRGLNILVLVVLAMLTYAVIAAEDTGNVPIPEAANVGDGEEKEVLTSLELQLRERISVDFRDMAIDDVIKIMADQADVDIIKSASVTGTVTAKLTDVPLEEALKNILAANGYGYILDKNMIRIASLEEITQTDERLVTRIYRINYADVKEVDKALQKFISSQGSISYSSGTSNIIVTDIESRIKAIDTFIEEIDRMTPQILVEVRIYDITVQETLDIGIEWEAGRNTTFVSGIGNNPTAGSRNPFLTSGFAGATSKTADTTGSLRFGWLNSGIDLDVILRAQQEKISAKLLANPRILVLDNERAFFDIVREIPYKETSTTGNTATETIQFKNVGVKLEVRPHVTRDSMVRLHIAPEFGVIVSRDEATNVPTVDTRKLETIILVKDGQTIVLGGLRKKDVSQQTNKIPLLGDLPLIGGLFRLEGEDTTITELVVFITPRIIKDPSLSETEQQNFEATNFSGPEPVLTRAEAGKK